MSEWLNKYTEHNSELVDLLVQYYKLHEDFLERQSPQRTQVLRRVLKRMRLAIKQMEETAQQRMKERSEEFLTKHPDKRKSGRKKQL